MSINLDDYESYDLGVDGSLSAVPRAEARDAYRRLMAAKSERTAMLRKLLEGSGIGLGLDDSSIQSLNDWFYTSVGADPTQSGCLLQPWYSIAGDIALFLGDAMIARNPDLYWELFTWGEKSVSYQRHVIMGFSTEDPKLRTNIDISRLVTTYGHRIIAKRGSTPTSELVSIRGSLIDVDAVAVHHRKSEIETDAFWRWLQNADSRA